MPHAWVQRDGHRVSTLDLLGKGFTLFTGGAGDAWSPAADSVSKSLGVPIAVHRIGPNTAIRDIDGKWAAITGLSSDGALLVRPDDFVGWRAQTLPAAPERELRKVLSRILAAS